MEIVLGVDAGNTKTIALVSDLQGNIVGKGRSGCGDIYGVKDKLEAIANLREATKQALAPFDLLPSQACFCLAGADWQDDYKYLKEQLIAIVPYTPFQLYNDGLGALRAGSPTGYGLAISVGTYVATASRSPTAFWHSSFWQEESGARYMAADCLKALYRADLGLMATSSMKDRILELYQLPTVEALLYNQTSLQTKAIFIHEGQIVRVLLEEADKGDKVALSIIKHHADLLTNTALVAIRKVGLESPFPLVFSGGVLKHPSRLLPGEIVKRLQTHYAIDVVNSQREPVLGALLFALEAKALANQQTLERLEASLPEAAFFST